jgi:diacylglycerol kinase (ATP)
LLAEKKKEHVSSLSTASHNNEQDRKKKSKHIDTLLVANPTSSSGSTGKDWENLYIKIKEAFGENPQVVFTKKADDGTALTRKFLKKGFIKMEMCREPTWVGFLVLR